MHVLDTENECLIVHFIPDTRTPRPYELFANYNDKIVVPSIFVPLEYPYAQKENNIVNLATGETCTSNTRKFGEIPYRICFNLDMCYLFDGEALLMEHNIRGYTIVLGETRKRTFDRPITAFFPLENRIIVACGQCIYALNEKLFFRTIRTKHAVNNTFPISTSHIGVITNNRIKIYDLLTGIVLSKTPKYSFEASVCPAVLINSTADVVFVEKKGGGCYAFKTQTPKPVLSRSSYIDLTINTIK